MSTTSLFHFLSEKFAPANAISRTQFREFMGISAPTEWRAYKSGNYPKVVRIGNHERILLTDLADFLDQPSEKVAPSEKKRGRPRLSATPAELLTTLGI